MGRGTQSSNTDNDFIDRPETHWMEDELHNDEQRSELVYQRAKLTDDLQH